jgi:hypothetical protein
MTDPKTEDDLAEMASRALGMVARGEMDSRTATTIMGLIKANLQVMKHRREKMPEIKDEDLARMTELEQVEAMEAYTNGWRKEQGAKTQHAYEGAASEEAGEG